MRRRDRTSERRGWYTMIRLVPALRETYRKALFPEFRENFDRECRRTVRWHKAMRRRGLLK